MIIVLLLCGIFLMPVLSEAQEKETSPKKMTAQRSADRQNAPRQSTCQLSDAERQELETDLAKMRTLIEQMQHNLAATSTGETPLKYQFQLDIQMWQILSQRMERQLEGSTKK